MNPDAFALLLSTVDPASAGEPVPAADDALLREVCDLARANGLYFAFVRRLEASDIDLPPGESARWAEELRAHERYRRTLELLRAASEHSRIEYAVIKNVWTIEHVPRDVDVFVPESDVAGFLEALGGQGFETLFDDGAEISTASSGSLRVDIYPRVHYLGRDFLSGAALAAARRTESFGGVRIPTVRADVAFALNSIHSIFGHGAITLLDFLDLRSLTIRSDDGHAGRAHAETFGWARTFDLWTEYLKRLGETVYERGIAPRFPLRHGRAFIRQAIALLDGEPLALRERIALRASLLWDDLLFASEGSGLNDGLRRSAMASSVANAAGHRLRTMRGDRKRSGGRGSG